MWGPPPPPGIERGCWLCWWSFPPPPPPPPHPHVGQSIIYDSTGNPVYSANAFQSAVPILTAEVSAPSETMSTPSSSPYTVRTTAPQYKEVKTLEYREGDPTSRHYLTIPDDAYHGQIIQVDLGGRQMSVKIPDYVQPGEKVVVVSPSPPAM